MSGRQAAAKMSRKIKKGEKSKSNWIPFRRKEVRINLALKFKF